MLTPGASDRLAKLIPLLSSDQPGEVVATAAAIGRVLPTLGLTWHDLAQAAARAGEPADPLETLLERIMRRVTRPSDRAWIERLAAFYARRGFLSHRQLALLADIEARSARHV